MKPAGWGHYIDDFHATRPGITETVLGECRADGANPYQWLAGGLRPGPGTVLDVACGSGPLAPLLSANSWIGLDRSEAELRTALRLHAGVALVRATADALPLPDRSVDSVVCSLALMVLTPLEPAIDELARVTRSGGTLAVLLPARRPLSLRDQSRYARLFLALRTQPAQFPNPDAMRDSHRLLAGGGFEVQSDEQIRFAYPIANTGTADALVDSFYLPDIGSRRIEAARRSVRRWTGSDLGIPLRRIVATLTQR